MDNPSERARDTDIDGAPRPRIWTNGTLVYTSGGLFALFALLFIPSTLYRISQQERILREQFGERWLTYTSDSKRIIPFIY